MVNQSRLTQWLQDSYKTKVIHFMGHSRFLNRILKGASMFLIGGPFFFFAVANFSFCLVDNRFVLICNTRWCVTSVLFPFFF